MNDPRELEKTGETNPQYMQQDQISGVLRGIVVDVRDPYQMGMAKVAVYSVQGDYPELNIRNMDFATMMQGIRGSFSPPQLNDKVLITYESGDKHSPMILGYWNAVPMGDGKLPGNKRVGSDVRPECWNNHDLYPETIMLGSSGDGNAVWMNDLFLSEKYLASSINLMDTGGKYFKIKSFHQDVEEVWSPVVKFPNEKGSLYNKDYGENKSKRDGTETLEDLEPTAGGIELGVHRSSRAIYTAKEEFSCDIMEQESTDEKSREEVSLSGQVYHNRLEGASIDMAGDALFMSALSGVFISQSLMAPRRYDDDE